MTLRLRLTLFYTLLVALVLVASGSGLYALLARKLYASLDTGLTEVAELVGAYVDNEGGRLVLREIDEPVPQLQADSVAVLYGLNGQQRDSLGLVPAGLQVMKLGFSTWRGWRVYAQSVLGGTLLTLRNQRTVEESLRQFLGSFVTLAPLATLLAFGLGYVLAGRALAPLARLTDATYDLARRRAWRERLPEPQQRDELWRLAQGTNELLAALEEVIESERRFTADAAHELRTPLTVLRGRLEKALEQTAAEKSVTSLRKALAASDVLLELSEKLLLLAQSDAGQGFTVAPLVLDEIALENAELLRPLFKRKELVFTLRLPVTPVWVRGDRVALALAVRNLLENALKFTSQGGVILSLGVNGNFAQLCVQDSGTGIPENAMALVFERFYQADVRYRQHGAGLGLALVKSVATWHGGDVWVENSAPKGTRFVLRLPLAEVPDDHGLLHDLR